MKKEQQRIAHVALVLPSLVRRRRDIRDPCLLHGNRIIVWRFDLTVFFEYRETIDLLL